MDLNSLKGNTQASKRIQETVPESNLDIPADRRVTRPVGSRVLSSIFAENIMEAKDDFIENVLIPTAKDIIVSLISNGIESLVYGTSGPRRYSGGKVNYSGIYRGGSRTSGRVINLNDYMDKRREDRGEIRQGTRGYSYQEIALSKGEAEDVLYTLRQKESQYGMVSVSDMYDAIIIAKKENYDILLCDTAGRLQNKVNLMNELAKMKRVLQKEMPDAPHETLLVIDATTGQNGMSQAKAFKEATDVTGVVLTKLDGTSKGGIVLAIRHELGIPIKYIGLGEKVSDLEVFDIEQYLYGLFADFFEE